MAAIIACLLFAFFPLTLLFEKVVMLEIPALSLSIGAIYFWIRYLKEERKADIYRFAFFACAALLTKQTVAFLIPVCVLAGRADEADDAQYSCRRPPGMWRPSAEWC